MKKIFLVLIVFGFKSVLFACTTFSFTAKDGTVVFGRNFDFPVGIGHIEINKRNLRKKSFVQPPEKTFEWVSKYGSITFNQAGKEFPYGGINEAGLVIELMWHREAVYPEKDNRYGLSELQWIQYQLDNSETVKEVIRSDAFVRISAASVSPLHFLVADADGDVATFEFLNGKMVVHTGNDLPYPVLTNCSYESSLEYMESTGNKVNKQYDEWTQNSSGRFVKAAWLIEKYKKPENPIDYSFDILDSVAQSKSTQWSIVYDITNRHIYFKTSTNPARQKIDMRDIDFTCGASNSYAFITDTIASVEDFRKYSFEANFKLMYDVVTQVDFLRNSLTEEAVKVSAKYPETVVCAGDDNLKKTP